MKAQLLISSALCVAGIAILLIGLFMPPIGEIHPSVLVAFGEIATFAGALLGVDYHYQYKKED